MAKMFYTLDETKVELGRTEDQIKQLTREGRLREFRDGARLMFRADQVDALKGQLGSGGGLENVDLGPSDSGAPIGLVDSRGGSGVGLSLADSAANAAPGSGLAGLSGAGMGSGMGSGLGSGMAGSGMMNLKEDTSLSADLGLSGSVGGMPSPARGSGAGSGSGVGTGGSGGSGGSRAGVNVLGEEEGGFDPMAQTAISSAPVADLNLESVGSGSGLLDLTRESDDTSLGAELIDEISTGQGGAARRPAAPPDSGAAVTAVGGSGVGLAAPSGGIVRGTVGVTYVEAPDPMAGALGGAALGAAFVVLFGIFALVSSAMGATDSMKWFADKSFLITAAIMLAAPVIGFIGGFLLGR